MFFSSHGTNRNIHSFPTRRSSDLAGLPEHSGPRLGWPGAPSQLTTPRVLTTVRRPRRRHTGPDLRSGQLGRSEEHTSELQSQFQLVCRLLLEKKKKRISRHPGYVV